MSWAQGYVTEIEYTQGFYEDLTPWSMSMAAIMQGREAIPMGRTFAYAELACGFGLSSLIMAAAYPEGKFFANDFLPAHVAWARRMAEEAGLSNIAIEEDSFEQFLDRELPNLDYVGMHGVYSWVSRENRAHIRRFVANRLRPGGLFMLSYNSQPGWAPMIPVQNLIRRLASAHPGDPAEGIRQAFKTLEKMGELGRGYVASLKFVQDRIKAASKLSVNYLIHEYLNDHWEALGSEEVIREMKESRLGYVGQAKLADQLDFLQLSEDSRKFLADFKEEGLRESVRDHLVGLQFRRDVYEKGGVRLPRDGWKERLFSVPFLLMVPRSAVKLEHKFPVGTINLEPEIYGPLCDLLGTSEATLAELKESPGLKTVSSENLLQALTVLLALGYVSPARRVLLDEAKSACFALNRAICRRAEYADSIGYLAASRLGRGVAVNRVHQLFMLAGQINKEPVGFAHSVLTRGGRRLVKDGTPLEGGEEGLRFLGGIHDAYQSATLPYLKLIGVAEE